MIAQETILRLRYKIIKLLGKGGIGETYLAQDLDLPIEPKPLCVVKRLQPKAQHPHILQMFQQEAEKLYTLGKNHPQIPNLFAYFEEKGEFYLVQELIEGYDLSREINSENIWSENEVIGFLLETLEILKYIHENNLIHRDIKPQNIMRRSQNNQLVLIDFGIVKDVTGSRINTLGHSIPTLVAGTPGYMPSEQALGKPKFSSDIYALGMTAIQALTGITPDQLDDNNEGEIDWRSHTEVSDDLAKILTCMTRYHFSQRYVDAAEALAAVKTLKPVVLKDVTKIIQITKTQTAVDLLSSENVSANPSTSVVGVVTTTRGLPKRLKIGLKLGFINSSGEIVIESKFDNAYKFSEGLAGVKVGKKWGFIDADGQMVIEPRFDDVGEFSEGLVKVKIESYWGYCNQKGELVIDANFKETWKFSEGLASVKIGSRWGYINNSGLLVIRPQFEATWWFTEGLSRVKIAEKWGYINHKGDVVIPLNYEYAWYFSDGLGCVKVKDHYGFIDKKGMLVIPPQFEGATNFYEGLAAVKIANRWGYVNLKGNIVIQPEYANTRKFSEGLAAVCIGNKWGYVDTLGDLVIKPQFDDAWWFSDQVSRVIIGGREAYINKKGQLIR